VDRQALVEEAIRTTRSILRDFDPAVDRTTAYSAFSLPTPNGADYRFIVYVYTDAEPQIAAELLAKPDSYFWYYSFEIAYFDAVDRQAATFLRELARLVGSESKIVETRGLLGRSYDCFLREAGVWSRFGTRPALLAPSLRRRRREFHSPAIHPS
jgi:hypothetical protein